MEVDQCCVAVWLQDLQQPNCSAKWKGGFWEQAWLTILSLPSNRCSVAKADAAGADEANVGTLDSMRVVELHLLMFSSFVEDRF